MNTLAPARRIVKPAAVIFHPTFARQLANPRFGILPQRERRLPVGPSAADAQWWAENNPANHSGPTDAELDAMAADALMADDADRFNALGYLPC